jgi:LuxR family transcriptional regulator, glucitol operon activator
LAFLRKPRNVAPNYFEVLRVEGFVAAQSGNIMRAKAAYEEAVALRPDRPPLRVWYAGFLLRYLDDPDEAIAQLEVAFKHDPSEFLIPIELARSYLHLQDYDKVISTLDGVDLTRSKNARLTRVYHDLVIQVHVRRADRTLDTGEAEPFVADAEALQRHVSTLPSHVVDARITRHIRHMISHIRRFILRENGSPLGVRAEGVLNSLSGQFQVRALPVEAVDGRFSGRVINLPAQQTFGFLEKGDGSRLFFHKGSFLLPGAFESLELGDEVTFEMGSNAQGECAVKLMPVSLDAPVLEHQVVPS